MTHDYLVKALAFNGEIRAYSVNATETIQEAQKRHYTWPTASAALGRTMTASLMMGAMLKADQKLTVTVDGDGPIGKIIADADAKGKVRGYVTNPQTHFPLNEQGKLDVRRAVGTTGAINVVKDVGMRDYYTGVALSFQVNSVKTSHIILRTVNKSLHQWGLVYLLTQITLSKQQEDLSFK